MPGRIRHFLRAAADPVETQVSDLAGLLVGLRATPAHVVGHSWGGTVALLLAARHPQLVRTLTLIEPEAISLFVGSPPRLARVLRLFVTRPRTALTILRTASDALPIRAAYRRGDDEQAIRLALNWANGYDFSRELGPVDRLHVLANVGFSKAGALADPIKVTDEDTGRIKCPTLLVVGERSPEFFSAYVAELATLIKQAQVVVIPNATHGMISQNPQALSEAIRSFVSKQGAIVAS